MPQARGGPLPPFGRRAPLGFHITLRPSDDGGVARHAADLRVAARVLHQQLASRGLFAFRVADTHVHVLLLGDRRTAGRLAQRAQVALSWRLRLQARFEPARFKPIVDTRHLANALRYVLRQEARHGTDLDPAHDGSSLPDLLGLRVLGDEMLRRVRLFLPRLSFEELWSWLDVTHEELAPDSAHLVEAAAAALALPDIYGASRPACAARAAAVRALSLPSAALARLLHVDPRSVRRLQARPVPPELSRAVAMQLRLRTALAHRARSWSTTAQTPRGPLDPA